jgi:hypothetical protein
MLFPRAKIFWPLRATDWNRPKSERNFLGVNDIFVNIICNLELTLGPKRQITLCSGKQQ